MSFVYTVYTQNSIKVTVYTIHSVLHDISNFLQTEEDTNALLLEARLKFYLETTPPKPPLLAPFTGFMDGGPKVSACKRLDN